MSTTYGNLYGLLYIPEDTKDDLVMDSGDALTNALAVQRTCVS
jgi:hypothetical protein